LFFLRRKTRWREEWMRDRSLFRDLLRQHPQASPQELARMTGRSVSWVKKWRKRFTEDDPHDPSVLCSRSRAHHAPYLLKTWGTHICTRWLQENKPLSKPEYRARLVYFSHRAPAARVGADL
jgi:hypothetical protein